MPGCSWVNNVASHLTMYKNLILNLLTAVRYLSQLSYYGKVQRKTRLLRIYIIKRRSEWASVMVKTLLANWFTIMIFDALKFFVLSHCSFPLFNCGSGNFVIKNLTWSECGQQWNTAANLWWSRKQFDAIVDKSWWSMGKE